MRQIICDYRTSLRCDSDEIVATRQIKSHNPQCNASLKDNCMLLENRNHNMTHNMCDPNIVVAMLHLLAFLLHKEP